MAAGIPKVKAGAKPASYNPGSRNSALGIIIGVVVVVIVAVGIFLAIFLNRPKPFVVNTDMLIGSPHAQQVDLYEDPQCPICGDMEKSPVGAKISQGITQNKISVRYHLLNFLNTSSASKDYSSRADAAFAAIAGAKLSHDEIEKVWQAYHTLLFTKVQPEEGGPKDHTNEELADLADQAARSVQVKLPAATKKQISEGKLVVDASNNADKALKSLESFGANGTPTVIVNGHVVDNPLDNKWIDQLLASQPNT